MSSVKTDVVAARPRNRKSHRKSRLGCKNCKLRSVKCDESKPVCKRCKASGFCCDFSSQGPMLQLQHAGVYKLDLSLSSQPVPSPRYSIPIALPCSTALGTYELRAEDFAALDRYRNRTVLHIGNKESQQLFSDLNGGLGVSHPFLLHIFIALAFIHDSCSYIALTPTDQALMSFHWYQGTVIFRRMLAQARFGVTRSEHDVLWASSVLLGSASFAYLGTHDPKKTWPFRDPDPSDLGWIKMGDGKRAVGEALGPPHEGSAFTRYRETVFGEPLPTGDDPIPLDVFPPSFYIVFGLSPSSNSALGACRRPASILAQILPHPFVPGKLARLLSFTLFMDDDYKELLAEKDPHALILLAWYYTKVIECKLWWMCHRAIVEGMSICLYLESKCAHDSLILETLVVPKMTFLAARQSSLCISAQSTDEHQFNAPAFHKEIDAWS